MKKIIGFVSIALALCMLLSVTACDTAAPISATDMPQETEPQVTQAAISTPDLDAEPFIVTRAGLVEDKPMEPSESKVTLSDRVSIDEVSHSIVTFSKPAHETVVENPNMNEEYREALLQALEYGYALFAVDITLDGIEDADNYEYMLEQVSNEAFRLRELGYNVWIGGTATDGKPYSIKGLLSHEQIINFPPSEDMPELLYYISLI